MRKTGTLLTALFAAFGVIFALLRLVLLKNHIDPGGLPAAGFVSGAANALPFLALVVCLTVSGVLSSKKMSNPDTPAFHSERHDLFFLILQIISAALILIHSIISYPVANEFFEKHNELGTPLGVYCALIMIIDAVCIYKGRQFKALAYLHILTPLYFCLQLGEIFTANLSNPILMYYSFECISLGAFALFLISQAGCILKKDQVSSVSFTGFMTLLFTPGAIVGAIANGASVLPYCAMLLYVLPKLTVILTGLVKRVKKEKKGSAKKTASEN